MRTTSVIASAFLGCLILASCGSNQNSVHTMTPPPQPTISISPTTVSLRHSLPGAPSTTQFTANVRNAADPSVVWSVTNAPNSIYDNLGTISETGLYTAPEGGSAAAMIVATLRAQPEYRASAMVQLDCAQRLLLSTPQGISVPINGRLPLVLVEEGSCSASAHGLSWTVNGLPNGSAETGVIVQGTGPGEAWYFPPASLPSAPVTVTASLRISPESTASATLTVREPEGDVIAVSPAEVTLGLAQKQEFKLFRGGQEIAAEWLVSGSAQADANKGWVWDGVFHSPYSEPSPKQVLVTGVDTATQPYRYASAFVTISAPAENDNPHLQGTYAVLFTTGGPLLGTVTFDGQGGISGSIETGGSFFSTPPLHRGDIKGTYELGFDGRAIVRATGPKPGYDEPQEHIWYLTFASTAYAEIQSVSTDGWIEGAGFLEQQNLKDFKLSDFDGTYVAAISNVPDCWPYTLCATTTDQYLGALRADGAGKFSGEIELYNGPLSWTGTYAIQGVGAGSMTSETGLPFEASVVLVSKDKFLFSGPDISSGVAERQSEQIAASTWKGPYVFNFGSWLARVEADGAGRISGVMETTAYASLGEPVVATETTIDSNFVFDPWGRTTVKLDNLDAVVYLISHDRFKIVGPVTKDAMFGLFSYRDAGEGYAQVVPLDLNDVLGRYAVLPTGGVHGYAGWISFAGNGRAVGAMGHDGESFSPALLLPSSTTGKGETGGFCSSAAYYVVSPDILLTAGCELRRMQ